MDAIRAPWAWLVLALAVVTVARRPDAAHVLPPPVGFVVDAIDAGSAVSATRLAGDVLARIAEDQLRADARVRLDALRGTGRDTGCRLPRHRRAKAVRVMCGNDPLCP